MVVVGTCHVRDTWTIARDADRSYLISVCRTRASLPLCHSVPLPLSLSFGVCVCRADNKEVIIDRPIGLATNYDAYQLTRSIPHSLPHSLSLSHWGKGRCSVGGRALIMIGFGCGCGCGVRGQPMTKCEKCPGQDHINMLNKQQQEKRRERGGVERYLYL